MLGNNPFRWFLFVVTALVALKLGYNLSHRLVSGRPRPAVGVRPPTAAEDDRNEKAETKAPIAPVDSAMVGAEAAKHTPRVRQ